MWVWDSATDRIVQRAITFVPGLYKIFDEILVNAADNKQRDHRMDAIKVTVDVGAGTISVWNNGARWLQWAQAVPVVGAAYRGGVSDPAPSRARPPTRACPPQVRASPSSYIRSTACTCLR